MRFLIDAHVRSDVAEFLQARGHEVFFVADRLMPGTPDPIIVADANQLSAIIVTWNRKHFRPLIARDDQKKAQQFPNVGLMSFGCSLDMAVPMLERFVPHIDLEYEERQAGDDRRLIVEIDHARIRIW